MSISVQANEDANRFDAVDEAGVVAGYVKYGTKGNSRVLFHTEVDDAFEGQGVGSTLAREAIEQSVAAGAEVVVTCPFLKDWVEQHPEYADQVTLG